MSGEEMSLEDLQAAKDVLDVAIKHYYTTVEPEAFIDEWILLTHKRSAEWEQENTSVIGLLTPTDQSWVMRRGILEAAVSAEQHRLWEEDDED